MQIVAIIGDPIRQAQSPAVFGAYFQKHRIDAVMVPLQVTAADFSAVLDGLGRIGNFKGLVVTIPHKMLACQLAELRGPMARATGAANVLVPTGNRQWSAEMFDGIGLLTALQKRGIDLSGMHVLLIGAGGAGTAIGVALEQLGRVGSITITEPDQARATALAARLRNSRVIDPQTNALEAGSHQLIINASPVGMRSDAIPFDPSQCTPGSIVCDAVMDPPKTRFLSLAEENGCTIVQGIEMLQGQVEPLAEFMGLAGPRAQQIAVRQTI